MLDQLVKNGQRRMNIASLRRAARAACMTGILILSGCGGIETESRYPERVGKNKYDPAPSGSGEKESVFGPGGLNLFGGGGSGEGGGGIGVNSYLWRASLDTIAFMPLSSADPFGGVIITDWYTSPAQPKERFKMTVYILDRRLRADGIKVSVFRQEKDTDGSWKDAPANADTGVRVENAILTRARQLRVDSEAS